MADAYLRRLGRQVREMYGTNLGGSHGATVGTTWSAFGAQSLNSFDSATLATGDMLSYATVFNRSSSATLYVLFGATTTPVAQAFSLRAGESFNFDIYGISNGAGVATMQLRGSASPTTVDITAFYISNPD